MTTLLIDNYDSFTWNVYQALACLGAKVQVFRNDKITLEEAIEINPKNLIISPGPGYPSSAKISNTLIKHFEGKIPILGVCLGEQCMYEIYGGAVKPCGQLIHGKTTPVSHDSQKLFRNVSQNIECTRYHSLAGDPETLPDVLEISAWTSDGLVMAIRHKTFVMEGVQFHPESIASEEGKLLFANFLSWSGGLWSDLVIDEIFMQEQSKLPNAALSMSQEKVGGGISLSLVSKLNSTARDIVRETKPDSILQKIVAKRRIDVHNQKSQVGQSMEYLERCYALGLAPNLISFKDRLMVSIAENGVAVLAEIKRASPSKGDIDINVHAPQQACLYARGGASVISVLTEPNWFKGSLDDLRNVRRALEGLEDRPAVLRKEFVFDRYQILEARLSGADTILLIVAVLDDIILADLMAYSRNLGMEPLVEVATVDEMKRALALGSTIIGVNNRDLNTFDVDMDKTSNLSSLVSSDIILLALSGITGRPDVEKYMDSGARGVLVGETLMRSNDKVGAVLALLGKPSSRKQSIPKVQTRVKICGLTNIEDALQARNAGADYLGLIFAKKSPRFVTMDRAAEIVSALNYQRPALMDSSFIAGVTSSREWYTNQTLQSNRALVVGVFTTHTAHEINTISNFCHLDLIQLHLPRNSSFHRLLNKPVVQVIGVNEETGIHGILEDAKSVVGSAQGILLDTTTTDLVGGTGKVFKWDLLNQIPFAVWMAGGITAENVEGTLKYKPCVVDVCSGVEVTPGTKDHAKVSLLIRNIKS